MEALFRLLFRASEVFLAPVVVALLLMLLWSAYVLGDFVAEAVSRSALGRRGLRSRLGRWFEERLSKGNNPGDVPRLVSLAEARAARMLEPTHIGVRLGPVLGLVGTLIPLSPAMVGLAKGDISVVAQNLRICFSTTVLGLIVGGVCFAVTTVRRRWYAEDMAEIEHLASNLTKGGGGNEGKEEAHRLPL